MGVCKADFLGNFYPSKIYAAGSPEWVKDAVNPQHDWQCSEAAYQAQKFPELDWDLFSKKGGEAALRLSHSPDLMEVRRSNWKKSTFDTMKQVLEAKFNDNSLSMALHRTGDSFLLEHNPEIGRDSRWSDNNDGSGQNLLGALLMLVRDQLPKNGFERVDPTQTGPSRTGLWTRFLIEQCHFNVETGEGLESSDVWKDWVRSTAAAVNNETRRRARAMRGTPPTGYRNCSFLSRQAHHECRQAVVDEVCLSVRLCVCGSSA